MRESTFVKNEKKYKKIYLIGILLKKELIFGKKRNLRKNLKFSRDDINYSVDMNYSVVNEYFN